MAGLFSKPKVIQAPKTPTRDDTVMSLMDRLRLARRSGKSRNILTKRRASFQGGSTSVGGGSPVGGTGPVGGGSGGGGSGGGGGGGGGGGVAVVN